MKNVIINPDYQRAQDVIIALKAREGYCPCALSKEPQFKCPCEQLRTNSRCHCGLFIKED